MKRRDFLKWTGAVGAITLITPANIEQTFKPNISSDLEESFIHPPDSAKPYAIWFWMNGNVTKEGITL
ncbi:MAG TPA: twin-arginine translocation signal domain-containing protein, partial [Chitinophagaceae bacterium]|nr:twin-arginine translocation signal domain-containing protein [Chitinophagaceae bacterium]